MASEPESSNHMSKHGLQSQNLIEIWNGGADYTMSIPAPDIVLGQDGNDI